MRDPFDLSGFGSAVDLARQFSAVADTRQQTLARFDELVGPKSLAAQMGESAQDEVLRAGRGSATQQAIARMQKDMQQAEELRRAIGVSGIDSMFGELAQTATSRMAKETLRIEEEMDRVDNLARMAGYGDIGSIFGDIDGSVTGRMAREALRVQDDWERQRKQFGIVDFEKNLASLGITQGFASAFEQLKSATYADFLARDVARYAPSGLASQVEHLVRSLDFDPMHRATRDLAELLERLREEEGDPDTIDDVEERIQNVDLTAVRAAWAALLVQAFKKSKDHGVQTWLLFMLWINTLSPAGLFLLSLAAGAVVEHGPDVATKAYQALAKPTPTETAAVTVPTHARPANPTSRISEVLFSERDVLVRSGPHSTQPVIGRIPARHLMRVTARRQGWYQVRFVDPAGEGSQVIGWVRAKGLKNASAETARKMWCLVTAEPTDEHCEGE